MLKVYYLTRDNGDGSSSVVFFRNYDNAYSKVDESNTELPSWERDMYYGNEGEVGCFEIPVGPNTIHFQD